MMVASAAGRAGRPRQTGLSSEATVTLTDEQIAAMQPRERRALVARPIWPGRSPRVSQRAFGRIRVVRRTLVIVCAAALIPWTVFLALTLPKDYTAHHWAATWVGFDVNLIAAFGSTVVLGLRRSPWAAVTAFTSGVLLV
jgi:hypothetical protein